LISFQEQEKNKRSTLR